MNSNYKEQSDKAYKYHSENNFAEAEKIYNELLKINPEDVNILNLYGLLCLATGRVKQAIDSLTKAFSLKKNSYISSNLAKAYYMNNEPEKAVKIYKESLALKENDDVYYSLGIAYKALNRYDNAIEAYKNAIRLKPDKYNALYNLSAVYKSKGDINNAILCAEKCLKLNNKDEGLYTLLSGYYEEINDTQNAIIMLQYASMLNPNNYVYHYNLGVLLAKAEDKVSAINSYIKSIELNKNHLESYVNIAGLYKGTDNEKALEYLKKAYSINPDEENLLLSLAQTYKDLYKNSESIEILKKLLNNNPNCAEAYSLWAINLMDKEEYNEALNMYNKAISINPMNNNYRHGKAIALKYSGNTEECKQILEEIVNSDKTATQSAITLGMMYLTERNFEKGMPLYCMRSYESKLKSVFNDKIWDKSINIENKDILVYTDCGLGDTIMYSRYLPIIKEKAKNLTLQTDKDLVSVLKSSYPNMNIIKKSIQPPHYDVVIPIMDLPYALNLDFNNIPYSDGYLNSNNEDKFDKIPEFQNNNKKVGLFWQGNKRIFKNRSIPFEIILKLLEHKDISFYSFQKDEEISGYDNLFNLNKYINDYSDTAGLLKNIDLLITIDSSIVHMAGALGIKTYLLLPYTAEWRWFDDKEVTPWYKSIKIFRQKNISDWIEVIDRVDKTL